jgi:hypothetical protein
MSVQSADTSSIYVSICPIVISEGDNILTYQTSLVVLSAKNNGGSVNSCYPNDHKLSYVNNKKQLNDCCGNILNKKTAV